MEEDAAAVIRDLRGSLVGALALYTGDEAWAEDLAQEAFARMVERWAQVREMDRPAAWVYRVAFNLARSGFRRAGVHRRVLRLLRAGPPEETGLGMAASMGLRQEVQALPPRQRAVILCRFYADLSVAETAEVLGCAPGTVKSTTAQALARLRRTDLLVDQEDAKGVEPHTAGARATDVHDTDEVTP